MALYHFDDAGYRTWSIDHRHGFVVSGPVTQSGILHRSTCQHIDISDNDAGRSWTATPKLCAEGRDDLHASPISRTPTRCRDGAP